MRSILVALLVAVGFCQKPLKLKTAVKTDIPFNTNLKTEKTKIHASLIQETTKIKQAMFSAWKQNAPDREIFLSMSILNSLPTLKRLGQNFIDQIPLL
ncbi:hypothetical protein [Helicobacter sp. L8]|uniref:hypothetical protein n=1 Tax=Helicobacter sp. L8 TaxID=2316078 RepID=UPI000EAE9474|nr:hypothetical protein [Helicobacter sp. L8]